MTCTALIVYTGTRVEMYSQQLAQLRHIPSSVLVKPYPLIYRPVRGKPNYPVLSPGQV